MYVGFLGARLGPLRLLLGGHLGQRLPPWDPTVTDSPNKAESRLAEAFCKCLEVWALRFVALVLVSTNSGVETYSSRFLGC